MSKTFSKIILWLVVSAVLGFLGYHLFTNWQNVRNFDFSFNYFYLILSFIILGFAFVQMSFIWNYILRKLEPDNRLSQLEALKIYTTAEFGKYAPGKVWNILGMVYLGGKKGLSKRNILIASILESVLATVVMLLVGIVFSAIFLSSINPLFYLFAFASVVVGLIAIHPKVFYPLFNFVLKKLKKTEAVPANFLKQKDILKIIIFYIGVSLLFGIAFFFFVKSLVVISLVALPGIIGLFCLAIALGIVVLFAPSGLGVRDGVLVALLLFYLPLGVATLITFVARVWVTLTEVILFLIVSLLSKILNLWKK